MLTGAEIQAVYAASSGICLPHLRDIFFNHDISEGLLFLVHETAGKLKTLDEHLREYDRKQSYQHRHAEVTENEQRAVMRAVEFFAGSKTK